MTETEQLIAQILSPLTVPAQRHCRFSALVRRFQDMAYGCAYAHLGDSSLAEDAAQDAFLTAWQCLPQLQSPAAFPGWLRRLVLTQCHRRTRGKQFATVPLDAAAHLVAPDDPQAAYQRAETWAAVQAAIQTLPQGERLAVILFYIGDYSRAEIAAFLGVSELAVKKRLASARGRLKERLIHLMEDELHEQRPSRDDAFAARITAFTDIPGLPKFVIGKVRDVYDLGDTLLIVTTDRLSAFDVVLPTGIPDKGRVLTQLSRFWFDRTQDIVPNHLIAADDDSLGQRLHDAGVEVTPDLMAQLAGRSLLVQKCAALPIECVVRGYLAGSAWKDYQTLFAHGGTVRLYDIPLPVGLRESDRLPTPLFTPATKAAIGAHDENISFARAAEIVGPDVAEAVRAKSLALYTAARDYAAARGILIADTKFEFGLRDGELILIDEALTPDSSRFWAADTYQPGRAQPSFDKQFVRDYLETLDWDKTAPGPALPPDIIEKTAQKYRDAYRLLTGTILP